MADIRQYVDSRTKTYEGNLVLGTTGHNYATSIPGKGATNAASSVATDGYVDIGNGYVQGLAVFNMSTIGAGGSIPALQTGAEARILLQGAKDVSFTTFVPLAALELGWATQTTSTDHLIKMIGGDAVQTHTRYSIPFSNRYGDQMYRYLRMWVHIGNTLATLGINGYLSALH